MADPIPIPKPHLQIQPKPVKKGNSCSDFVIKFLFLAIFVVVLPLFPSQAPEFLNQTILTKLWELLHLLFIGIVVAYGLFSRRNAELETNLETQPSGDSSNSNNSTTPSYVSKFFPASTIFGDESEIENGFDENKMMHWNNSQYFEGNTNSTVGVFDEQYKTQKLSNSEDSFGYSVRFDDRFDDGSGTNVVQSWNSEYYYSEPVVVAQPYYDNGQSGEVVGHKPLGLPVRSLKLVEREVDGLRYVDENASDLSLGLMRSSKRLDMSEDREFGVMDPTNLEKEFNDAAVGGVGDGIVSPIDWNSRFGRMEREKVYGNVNGSSQFSSVSVDETKFDGLGSNSLQSTASFFTHAGMYSSFESIASDNVNFQQEEMSRKESSFVHASEMKNFQDKEVRRRKTSFVPAPENMIFEEDEMTRKESSFVHASEMKSFQDKDGRQRKTSFVPAPENMIFEEEDVEQRIQRRDLGKKISEGRSLRNRRMATKGKHADGVYPVNFRTKSADETQFESHSSQSAGMYSSVNSISSDTIDFQEEDIKAQKESFPLHTSENMDSREEDMEQKNTSYVHATENVDFHVEDLGQKKNSFVPVSEDMNFEEMDLVKMISQVSSRNETMETRGRYAAVPHPSHFRPISVDEIQLESRSSRSLQSMGSFSSHTSNTSMRSSLDSVSSENMNLPQEGLGEKKSLHGSSSSSSSSSSPSSSARRNGETSLQPFEDRGYSINGLLHDDLKSKGGIVGEDPPRYEESVMQGLNSDSDNKPTSLAKALAKGKSVRTRRVSGLTSETKKIDEISSKQANDDKVVVKKPKSREPDSILKGISKNTLDCYFPNHNEGTFSSHRKRDKPEPSKNVNKEDSDNKLESIQGSSDDDRVSEYVNDSGLDSEVDKKASEFIAKFKAQIRLQKTVSIERSKGQKMFGDNNVR
ncbi:unnamed protein product [Vicia faba]|uniref:Uncharacterized protein n=1 Tax=Vicia faba TaxID=3906 RepID=A0AAV0YZW5_VICFA|nr:unnamed protein product [Vicia faba]